MEHARDSHPGTSSSGNVVFASRVPTTIDTFLGGRVQIEQPAPGHGYRFNVDALWLARFAARNRHTIRHAVDLGAGVGAVSTCLAMLTSVRRLTLLDSDAGACVIARRNLARNGLDDRASTHVADVADPAWSATLDEVDLLVCNPPYGMPGSARACKSAELEAARRGDVTPFVHAMARVISQSPAVACLCYPARSLVPLLHTISAARLWVRRVAFVHASRSRPARIVLVELASLGVTQMRVEVDEPVFEADERNRSCTPPIIERQATGRARWRTPRARSDD